MVSEVEGQFWWALEVPTVSRRDGIEASDGGLGFWDERGDSQCR